MRVTSRRQLVPLDDRPPASARTLRPCAIMPPRWHDHAMPRVRISTTVDQQLLADARSALDGQTDAAVIDHALRSLLQRHRSATFDAAYSAYDDHPLDEADEWGDLASFRSAAGAT